jgi:release factor glutamine methyltransferase
VTFEEGARLLAAAGLESPRAEARLLYARALAVTRDETLSPALKPTPSQAAQFAAMIARRAAREPSAYITGHKEFWSMDFAVGPGVLVPRPETETLIEEALRLFPGRSAPLRIADLGAGSGVLLLAALREFPNAMGVGFESSPEAFVWAERNAARHAGPRAEIRLADWQEALNGTTKSPFDLVFSNPPYIASAEIASLDREVSAFEPRAALDGGPDGLSAYRALRDVLPSLLGPGGYALLELGAGQAKAVEALFRGSLLRPMRTVPDLAAIPRVLVLEKAP